MSFCPQDLRSGISRSPDILLRICGISFPFSGSPHHRSHSISLCILASSTFIFIDTLFNSLVLTYTLLSPAADGGTSDDCQSCLECSRDNGCVRCPERLFLFLQREGISHHGTCVHACPAGHYGQRGKDISRCMSMLSGYFTCRSLSTK